MAVVLAVEGLVNSASGDSAGPAAVTIPSPTGGVLADDQIIYEVFHCEAEDNTFTAPGGTTVVQAELQVGGTPPSVPGLEVHRETAIGGEEGETRNFTVSFTGGWMIHCYIGRGIDSTTPIDVTPTTATGTTGDPDAPSIDPITDDCGIQIVGVQDDTVAATLTSHPTNYTGRAFISNDTANPTGGNSMSATRIITGSAAENPGVWDISVSDEWAACSIPWRPAVTLTREQEGHQFREDDGSESAATDIGAQDSNINRPKNTNTRLRINMNATGDPPTEGSLLQFKRVADAVTEWENLVT